MANKNHTGRYIFGLDIGTRNMVGTVGYKDARNHFIVEAQVSLEHQTRAMLDGQIHDINMVAESIVQIKDKLEDMIKRPLEDVCIAAAGRVLRTIRKRVDQELPEETIVTPEHVYSLEMLAVEKAYDEIRELTASDITRFYCVGYSVVQYYLNDYAISVLDEHKAVKIGVELIATFLPDEVVDGLYAVVEKAGLKVANMTLEPIAAINVAIPEAYRLLNIALVDVGAGTSDISIAKGGRIEAFGMMPFAGDEITEVIAAKCLTEFKVAEDIKKSLNRKTIKFKDIMGLSQTISQAELLKTIKPTVDRIAKETADKIIELNGDKPVSAVFVVGGGGKIIGYTDALADYLGIAKERVAIRGPEVMHNIDFKQDIKKDSLLVTPIGICLNFYEQKNNFIQVVINGEHIKLYDNDRVTVMDAALQLGLANDFLFPKRGDEIIYTINGEKRMVRGEQGEPSKIFVNGRESNLNASIEANDKIVIEESTKGAAAVCVVQSLPEYSSDIVFYVNGSEIVCPRYVSVNRKLVPGSYNIATGDVIEVLDYYTLGQVLDFMDLPYHEGITVNNEAAGPEEKVYANFKIQYNILKERQDMSYHDLPVDDKEAEADYHYADESIGGRDQYDDGSTHDDSAIYAGAKRAGEGGGTGENVQAGATTRAAGAHEAGNMSVPGHTGGGVGASENNSQVETGDIPKPVDSKPKEIAVIVNNTRVVLKGKSSYIFVDILDFYPFDTSVIGGKKLQLTVNDETATFTSPIDEGDIIRLYWEK